MSSFRIRASELRQLGALLTALLEDADLMAELSLMEREHIRVAAEALQPLFAIVAARDTEESLNES